MTTCAYCEQRATVKIPSNPGRVCVTHAVEYWAALFDLVKERAVARETPNVPPCACGSCNELTAAAHARAVSIAAAGASPLATDPSLLRPRGAAAYQAASSA